MARFRFKLDPVLRQRRRMEDRLQRRLAESLRQHLAFETQLRTMQQTISDDKHDMSDALRGTVDVGRIRVHAAHVGQVTVRAQQIAVKLMHLHRQIERQRTELIEASRRRKAIERLRERRLHQWQRARERREAAELDELATMRAGRQEVSP